MKLIKPRCEILTPILRADILRMIEEAGRTAYQSEHKDNPAAFVKMLRGRKHFSPFEHCSLTAKFLCDRGISHELVRHRLCSIVQESTRYCGYDKLSFIIPPWVPVEPGEYTERMDDGDPVGEWWNSMLDAEQHYLRLRKAHRWSAEMARSVLPSSLAANLVLTANLREWMYILELRCAPTAHPQMRELLQPVRHILQNTLPEIFA